MKSNYTTSRQRGIGRIATIAGIAVLVVLVVAGLLYGPDLVAYYRFDKALTTIARDEEANGGKWPRVSDGCAVCHGFNGNTATQFYARLAGQPARRA